MRIHRSLLPVVLMIGAISTANAVPIQIDFTGTVTFAHDQFGNALAGSVAAGDTATGRLIFDDEVLPNLMTRDDYFSDSVVYSAPWADLDWISGYITVNGASYVVDRPDGLYTDSLVIIAEDPVSQFPGQSTLHNATAISELTDTGGRTEETSLQLSHFPNGLSSTEGLDIESVLRSFQIFTFFDVEYVYALEAGSEISYTKNAQVNGQITSISVTRLDPVSVPEPSTLALLAAGVFGLGLTRRLSRN